MPTVRRVYKQGHSFVVGIPAYLLDHLGIDVGDSLILDASEKRVLKLSRASLYDQKESKKLDVQVYRLTTKLLSEFMAKSEKSPPLTTPP